MEFLISVQQNRGPIKSFLRIKATPVVPICWHPNDKLTSMYMRMRTMEQKYVLSASLTNRGAKTTHHEVESGRPLSTLNSERRDSSAERIGRKCHSLSFTQRCKYIYANASPSVTLWSLARISRNLIERNLHFRAYNITYICISFLVNYCPRSEVKPLI